MLYVKVPVLDVSAEIKATAGWHSGNVHCFKVCIIISFLGYIK